MKQETRRAIEEEAGEGSEQAVELAVERARQKTMSKQPRFQGDTTTAFGSILQWTYIAEIASVAYAANSMARDRWLQGFWRLEPHLAGVINSVVLVDSNRGWELVGGRNQVLRFTDVLHNAEGGNGWRELCRKLSLSYWTTDLGSITELGRDGKNGPLRGLFHVDPGRCYLTGNTVTPLAYHPHQGGQQMWTNADFFRCGSLPSDDEAFRGLGFSAVSRCLETIRLLYAVLCHDQEQVAARAPKGILTLHNISEQQWEDSLKAREAKLDGLERRYYGGVQVLASSGADEIDVKLIALSQLPANFDAKMFTDLCMYTYALAFGYDPSEFWPVQFGAIGRGTETEVQHSKASGKGGTDFALAYQERLQQELPETLQFQFEQRDDQGELTNAAVQKAKGDVVRTLYESGLTQGAPLLSREEARSLLAADGLIPEEWTEQEEQATATDTEDADSPGTEEPLPDEASTPAVEEGAAPGAERWLELPRVQRAMARFEREDIVRYSWPTARMQTLWRPRGRPKFHVVHRAGTAGVLYDKGGVTITEDDVDHAIAMAKKRVGAEFAELLDAPTATAEQIAAWGKK